MRYYTIQNGSILTANTEQALARYYTNVQILPEDYIEGKYVIIDGELVLNENYEAEQAQKEAERIANLYMTRSDFFDGTIKALGLDETDLLLIIEQVLPLVVIEPIDRKVAINNFKNALNFHRIHPLFDMISNTPLPVSEDTSIVITSKQWDEYFDRVNKKDSKAYESIIPAEIIEVKEIEDEDTTDTTES